MRLPRLLHVLVVLAAVLLFAGPRNAAGCECDSPHVRHDGNVRHHDSVIRVYPTHHDDTANLRCALAVASREPGHTIELAAGQFWTRQLWAQNFVGTLKGQGADKTILSNPGPLQVATGNVLMSPPSRANLWPALMTFVDGDFTVSDLTIRIKGPQVTTAPWSFGGLLDAENALAGEIIVTGSKADASFTRLTIEGATVEQGFSAPYGDVVSIFYQPILGFYAKPMSGRFAVTGCTFRNVSEGFNAIGVEHAEVTWHANTILASGVGFELFDAAHTVLEAIGNKIETTTDSAFPACIIGGTAFVGLGLKYTTVLIADNNITSPGTGLYGISVDPDVFERDHVILVDNAVASVDGIYLGKETVGCIVKADGVPVVDDGSANWVLP